MIVSKRNLLFQGAIVRFHVKLLEGKSHVSPFEASSIFVWAFQGGDSGTPIIP